jgi:hypothetical protein
MFKGDLVYFRGKPTHVLAFYAGRSAIEPFRGGVLTWFRRERCPGCYPPFDENSKFPVKRGASEEGHARAEKSKSRGHGIAGGRRIAGLAVGRKSRKGSPISGCAARHPEVPLGRRGGCRRPCASSFNPTLDRPCHPRKSGGGSRWWNGCAAWREGVRTRQNAQGHCSLIAEASPVAVAGREPVLWAFLGRPKAGCKGG